jgi:ABC-type sugar transport system ATPase subunit
VDNYLIEINDLSKSFPGVKALDDVSFKVKEATVHGLVGENGAGKSTLIKILSGIYPEYEGNILFFGKNLKINSAVDAQNLGISTIFQEVTLVPKLSIAENIFLGRELVRSGAFVNKREIIRKSEEALGFLSSPLKPKTLVENLSVANQQIVEICKAIVLDSKLIIMDEPTSSLTKKETDRLFSLIRKLRSNGKTVLYVSHKIDEVFEICDSVTVLRDGKHIDTVKKKDTSPNDIISMMVGRELKAMFPDRTLDKGDLVMTVSELSRSGEFNNISFDLYKGEILGIGGLIGAGRTELAKAIIGVTRPDGGKIEIFNNTIKFFDSPKRAISNGLTYLPEDRKEEGIFPLMAVKDNICISILKMISRFSFISNKKMENFSRRFVDRFRIRITSIEQREETLSGGNQQKTIISRFLATKSKIFIFDEPTRGIDVGAKFEIYNIMNEITAEGGAIIFISSELPELINMSDRLLLMRSGLMVQEFEKRDANEEDIMKVLTKGEINAN